MTEYEQLQEAYKEYSKLEVLREEIQKIEEKNSKLVNPKIKTIDKAIKKENRSYLSLKVNHLIVLIISTLIFFIVIVPYIFPIIGDSFEWFNQFKEIPEEANRTIYLVYIISGSLIPLFFYIPTLPDYTTYTPIVGIIMGVVALVMTYLIIIVLSILTTFYLVTSSDSLDQFLINLESAGQIASMHIGIQGIIFLVIGFGVFRKRSEKILSQRVDKNDIYDQSKKSTQEEIDYWDQLSRNNNELDILQEELSVLFNKIKKTEYYRRFEKEKPGYDVIMTYFGEGRIHSLSEANYIFNIEEDLYKMYQKELRKIDAHTQNVIAGHNNLRDMMKQSLDDAKYKSRSIGFDQEVELQRQEEVLEKLKNINR